MIEKILEFDREHKKNIALRTQRFVYKDISAHINDFYKLKNILNIIFITGLRGVGKTTILNTIIGDKDTIYSSGDFLYQNNLKLSDFFNSIKDFKIPIIIIDEVQYLDWQLDLKIFADLYPNKLIIVSGSSSININKFSADLVRRSKTFIIDPLSFREYLHIKKQIDVDVDNKIKDIIFAETSLEEKYFSLIKIENEITPEIKEEFNFYIKSSFPYMFEKYDKKVIQEVIYKVIYEDIPKIESFNTEKLEVIKKILHFLTVNEKTSITNISKTTGEPKTNVLKFINLLEKAKLIDYIESAVPTKRLGDMKKYLFYTPNFRIALTNTDDAIIRGMSREDLFSRIIKSIEKPIKYNYNKGQVDFFVDNLLFEVGSKNKKVLDRKGAIVIYDGELKYDGKNLYLPFEMFSLIV